MYRPLKSPHNPLLPYNSHKVTNFQMKSEFVYVKPKTSEASEYFEHEMRSLHSCKVKDKRDGKLLLSSISGNYNFWVSESEDRNWKLLNSH